MTKILITGAGSYVGMEFEKYIKSHDDYIVDTVDMIGEQWKEYSFSGYDTVFHVAGLAHINLGTKTEEMKEKYFSINTKLAIATAEKAKAEGVRQFIFMSSASVYGDSAPIGKEKMITKNTLPLPMSYYGESKLQAEKGIVELEDDSFKVVILRPPMIYGRGCRGNYQTVSRLAKKCFVFPRVANKRSAIYIKNFTRFVKLMIDNCERGVFCPQNKEYFNTTILVKIISELYGKKVLIIKGMNWALKLLSKVTGLVNKAFGDFCYEQSMSEYKDDYRTYDLYESIVQTEQRLP